MDQFSYSASAQKIIFAAGALDQLASAVDQFGWRRLLLCAGPSQARTGAVAAALRVLGDRCVAVITDVQPHVQAAQVKSTIALVRSHDVDAIIGFGGGSAVGLAKAVSLACEPAAGTAEVSRHIAPGRQAIVPSIAIPTTYAGSEMTPVVGVTRVESGGSRKVTVNDSRIVPRLVIYDPLLTLTLPPEVTAATGINALAHAVEALYSIAANPLASAAAEMAIRRLYAALPVVWANGANLAARSESLLGAHLAGAALATVKMGVHHGACHALGGALGVPHATAHSILLPYAMRFNLPYTVSGQAAAARAMGLAEAHTPDELAAATAADGVAALTQQMGLPQRLRDAGVEQAQLAIVAEQMLLSPAVCDNPKPVKDAATALELLEAAW